MTHLEPFGLSRILKHASSFAPFASRAAMTLNGNTVANLELLRNSTDFREEGSLVSVLDRCRTAMGKRLLRRWVTKPLLSLECVLSLLPSSSSPCLAKTDDPPRRLITERHNALTAIHTSSASLTLSKLRDLLRTLPDLERGLSRIHLGRAKPQELLRVLESFVRTGRVFEELENEEAGEDERDGGGRLKSALLKRIVDDLPRVRGTAEALLGELELKAARDGLKEALFVDEDKYPALKVRPSRSPFRSRASQSETDSRLLIAQECKDGLARTMDDMQDELKSARKILRKPALQFTKVSQEEYLCVPFLSPSLALFERATADASAATGSRSRSPRPRASPPTGCASRRPSRCTGTARRRCRKRSTSSSSGRRKSPAVRPSRFVVVAVVQLELTSLFAAASDAFLAFLQCVSLSSFAPRPSTDACLLTGRSHRTTSCSARRSSRSHRPTASSASRSSRTRTTGRARRSSPRRARSSSKARGTRSSRPSRTRCSCRTTSSSARASGATCSSRASTWAVRPSLSLSLSLPLHLRADSSSLAGKSSLSRSIALIALLAQMGSFVPAEAATLSLFDGIFTRCVSTLSRRCTSRTGLTRCTSNSMGASDDLARGRSTFMVELSETSAILRAATPRSLLILDELGRGTSTHDGLAIAHAVLEHLVRAVGCTTVFVTHYPALGSLARRFPGEVTAEHMACREEAAHDGEPPRITFLYKLVDGLASASHGLNVARLAEIPEDVVQRAKDKGLELERIEGERTARRRERRLAEVLRRVEGLVRGGAEGGEARKEGREVLELCEIALAK